MHMTFFSSSSSSEGIGGKVRNPILFFKSSEKESKHGFSSNLGSYAEKSKK